MLKSGEESLDEPRDGELSGIYCSEQKKLTYRTCNYAVLSVIIAYLPIYVERTLRNRMVITL